MTATANQQGTPISHLGSFGLEYQFNERNKLELAGNVNFQDLKRTQNTLSQWEGPAKNITSKYNTFRLNEEKEMEWESSAVFLHQFKKEGHELQFEVNITGYDETEDNHFTESSHGT